MPKSEVFSVTPELQEILDSLPAKGPRSRLDPFRPFILRWRREGRTYRDIQEILAVACKVRVAHQTVRRYVKRRAKPRKPVEPEMEAATVQTVRPLPVTKSAIPNKNSDPSSDPYAEARERMRKHKEAAAVKKQEPLFPVYTDEELLEPHVLNPTDKKEN